MAGSIADAVDKIGQEMNMLSRIVTALSNSKDAIQAVFATVGTVVAVLGLSTWRRQLKGKAEYDLAVRLLRAVYTVRDRVDSLRDPFISMGETDAALKNKTGDNASLDLLAGQQANRRALAYEARWERVKEAISDLEVQEREAEVFWGDKIKSTWKPFYECLAELRTALDLYLSEDFGECSAEEKQMIIHIVLRVPGAKKGQIEDFGHSFENAIKGVVRGIRPYLDIK